MTLLPCYFARVSLVTVLCALAGCASRRFEAQVRSDGVGIADDPGGYFAFPGAGPRSDGVRAVLVRTVPMLTHASLSSARAWVAKALPAGWKAQPWGTERYTHVAYATTAEALEALNEPSAIKALQREGGRKLSMVKIVSQPDLDKDAMVALDDVGHSVSASSRVAEIVAGKEAVASYSSDLNGRAAIFRDVPLAELTTRDPDWSLKFGRIPEAQAFIAEKLAKAPAGGAKAVRPGEGVRVGVIDTGYPVSYTHLTLPTKA